MLAILFSIGAVLGQPVQNQGTPGLPTPQDTPRALPGQSSAPVVAIDGKPATPGRIPEGISPEALQLWSTMLTANRAQDDSQGVMGTPIAPIRSFDLTFDADIRQASDQAASNVVVRFQFLQEKASYLAAQFERTERINMRGPEGNHLYDGQTQQWIDLNTREDMESRRELDRWIVIAKNFIALTQPNAIRIVNMRALVVEATDAMPPSAEQIPTAEQANRIAFVGGQSIFMPQAAFMVQAQSLRWLEVTSPDFQLFDSGVQAPLGKQPMYRAILGLDAKGKIAMAQFYEDHQGATQLSGALFVHINGWSTLRSGYSLPKLLNTYQPLEGITGFGPLPTLSLFLKSKTARINPTTPKLTPLDFTKSGRKIRFNKRGR